MSRVDPERDDPLGHVHVLPQRREVRLSARFGGECDLGRNALLGLLPDISCMRQRFASVQVRCTFPQVISKTRSRDPCQKAGGVSHPPPAFFGPFTISRQLTEFLTRLPT